MKTAEEILNSYKGESAYIHEDDAIGAMKVYAQSAIDEIKEKIAEELMITSNTGKMLLLCEDDKENVRSVTIELK